MNKSSKHRWLTRQSKDPFVKQAKLEGWRSRAVFKLKALDDKYKLVKHHQSIVDLGSAPGGWSQYVSHKTKETASVFALDILPMDPLPGVTFIQGDFTEDAALQALEQAMIEQQISKGQTTPKAALVISDMAPNLSGVISVDIPKAYYLAELALDFACQYLKPGGHFVVKLFQGEGFEAYIKACRAQFKKVHLEKPKASRAKSREVYAVGLGFKAKS